MIGCWTVKSGQLSNLAILSFTCRRRQERWGHMNSLKIARERPGPCKDSNLGCEKLKQPELMWLRDGSEKAQNVSLDGGHTLAARKKSVKKPTSRAAHKARWPKLLKYRCERKLISMSGVIGRLRKEMWRFGFF